MEWGRFFVLQDNIWQTLLHIIGLSKSELLFFITPSRTGPCCLLRLIGGGALVVGDWLLVGNWLIDWRCHGLAGNELLRRSSFQTGQFKRKHFDRWIRSSCGGGRYRGARSRQVWLYMYSQILFKWPCLEAAKLMIWYGTLGDLIVKPVLKITYIITPLPSGVGGGEEGKRWSNMPFGV